MLLVDGASNTKGNDVGIILENEDEIQLQLLVKFEFLASNNQAEYEALIMGFQLAGVKRLTMYSDSQLQCPKYRGLSG